MRGDPHRASRYGATRWPQRNGQRPKQGLKIGHEVAGLLIACRYHQERLATAPRKSSQHHSPCRAAE